MCRIKGEFVYAVGNIKEQSREKKMPKAQVEALLADKAMSFNFSLRSGICNTVLFSEVLLNQKELFQASEDYGSASVTVTI